MSFKKWIEDRDFSGELRFQENLSQHTYYSIGGSAEVMVFPKTPEDLETIGLGLRETGSDFVFLGQGSNVLVSDDGYPGVVIRSSRLAFPTKLSEDRLGVSAGQPIFPLLQRAGRMGWGGLEFLTGVPGSIGGAVVMNAGTHVGETKDALRKVAFYDFDRGELVETTEFKYAYRRNDYLPPRALVLWAELEVEKRDPEKVHGDIQALMERRKSSQPVEYRSCGSVFKNPKVHGMHAWQVMDRLELRGVRSGQAQFSEKHPNFIINHGNAKSEDVRELIQLAKNRAKQELGIELQEEVRYI